MNKRSGLSTSLTLENVIALNKLKKKKKTYINVIFVSWREYSKKSDFFRVCFLTDFGCGDPPTQVQH